MKKTLKVIALSAVVATLMSGCITATILRTKWASDEKKEITSGKVFEVAQGTVVYSDGTILSFKEHGKYIRIDHTNLNITIITPEYAYECYYYKGTYARQENTDGTFYYSNLSYVFPVEWFRWEKFADDLVDNQNHSEGTKYVADQKCISFTKDRYEVAGYKRIYMYKEEDGTVLRRAMSFTSHCDADFNVPASYTKTSDKITFDESF